MRVTSLQKKPRTPKKLREVFVYDLILYAFCSPPALAGIWIAYALYGGDRLASPWNTVSLVAAILLTYVFTKRLVIGCVLCYKAFAPLDMRDSCRFTPTCSTYMIMAINKYGLFIGVIKGFRRIKRCKPPNGGVDYP